MKGNIPTAGASRSLCRLAQADVRYRGFQTKTTPTSDLTPGSTPRSFQLQLRKETGEDKIVKMPLDAFFVVTASALALSALTTIPAVVAQTSRRQSAKPATRYDDDDGEATPESLSAFSTTWQKGHILVWAAAGLGCHIAFSVLLDASHSSHDAPEGFSLQTWLLTAAWVRLSRWPAN